MITDYRFKGFGPGGKLVQGTFTAESAKDAKLQAARLTAKYQLRIESLEKKRDWLYKVYIGGKKPYTGRQSAYSREDRKSVV